VTGTRDSTRGRAIAVFALLFLVYNANGREMGTTDSQPLKFTAREIAARGTLALDRVIAERPGLAERAAFARDRAGHYRSSYPIAPAAIAAAPAAVLHATGLVDMDAALASNLLAKLTASALTAWAVALVLLAVSRLVPTIPAGFAAVALGAGTNYWVVASQTLWRHETVVFGTALALWAWLRDPPNIRASHLWVGGAGLALAVASRPQVLVLGLAMLAWAASRAGLRRAMVPAGVVAAALGIVAALNMLWFGGPLGALPALEALHPTIHGVPDPIGREPWIAAAGLLVSPSRGLLVFSPVLVVALAAVGPSWAVVRAAGLRWLAAACALQFVAYAAYAVWWGGHTYGPRYTIDLLVPLAPFLALGADRVLRHTVTGALAVVLLTASVGIAAMGAIVYPNERWNTSPEGVDLHHERLWDWRDSQIERVFRSAPSPQNFNLFSRRAIRPDAP
jgi:hypothetical protein